MIATNETATREVTKPLVQVNHLERDRIFSWLGLSFALAVSAVLNMWNLSQNGYSNLYYSVAVQSMLQSFHNFFFVSYDAGGYISVDKPPVALWIQAISAKIFGFSPLSLLIPEALAGVASVALVYFIVKRIFGTLAGFIAAMALAITPIAVAVERTNNTDTWLMFFLLLAAWAVLRATERGQFKFLALGLALVGVGFNTKMLAAFIVLPTFYLLYLIAAPISWPKRIAHLALGSAVLLGVALSWPLTVDLTPASQRPWVGGSQRDSVLDLALNYNGLGRVTGNEGTGGGFAPFRNGGGAPPRNFGNPGNNQLPQGNPPAGSQPQPGGNPLPFFGGGGATGAGRGGFGGGGGMFGAGLAGPTRLFFGGELGGQWSWLFPMIGFGVLAAALALKRKWPLERRGQSLLLWAGWLITYGVVFSMAEGIFHPYYLVMLAPAAAALTGIGLAALWNAYRNGGWQAWLLPFALLVTAFWENMVLAGYPQWGVWLIPLTLGGALIAAISLAGVRLLDMSVWRHWAPGLVSAGLIAVLISPTVWSVTPVLAGPSNASLPVAGPEALNQNDPTSWTQMSATANSPLVSYLQANQDGYFYLVAVANSQQASSIALATGQPVLATGGFMGSDPALTVDKLAQMVANKQVRFVMGIGGGGGFGMRGGGTSSVNSWVQQNCSAVDPSQYQGTGGTGGFAGAFGFGNSQLYDCAAQSNQSAQATP